jgi:hypothetical protein
VYNVLSLNPGDYMVAVTLKGFTKQVVNKVTVGAAQQPSIDVVMAVGKETSEVTVYAQNEHPEELRRCEFSSTACREPKAVARTETLRRSHR